MDSSGLAFLGEPPRPRRPMFSRPSENTERRVRSGRRGGSEDCNALRGMGLWEFCKLLPQRF